MATLMASEIIRQNKLSEQQVFISRACSGNCTLSPLEKVPEAAERISGCQVVVLPGIALNAEGSLVSDHLRLLSPGAVVSFHVTGRDTIQSRKHTVTEDGKEAIRSVLSVKTVLLS